MSERVQNEQASEKLANYNGSSKGRSNQDRLSLTGQVRTGPVSTDEVRTGLVGTVQVRMVKSGPV